MNKIIINILASFIPSKNKRDLFRYRNRLKESLSLGNKLVLVREDGKEVFCPKICGLNVIFKGKNSLVKVYEPCKFKNTILRVGDNNIVEIKKSKHEIAGFIAFCNNNSKIFIGENFSCLGCTYYNHVDPNITLKICDDCMFSYGIEIWASDAHAIIDSDGNCLNKAEDIFISNHVWVGMGVTILKGSFIPKNSLIGCRSVFTKSSSLDKKFNTKDSRFEGGGIIFAGIPAKKIKSNINWDSNSCYDYELKLKEKKNESR